MIVRPPCEVLYLDVDVQVRTGNATQPLSGEMCTGTFRPFSSTTCATGRSNHSNNSSDSNCNSISNSKTVIITLIMIRVTTTFPRTFQVISSCSQRRYLPSVPVMLKIRNSLYILYVPVMLKSPYQAFL